MGYILVRCGRHTVDFICFFTSEVSQTCGPGKKECQLQLFGPTDVQDVVKYLLILSLCWNDVDDQ